MDNKELNGRVELLEFQLEDIFEQLDCFAQSVKEGTDPKIATLDFLETYREYRKLIIVGEGDE